MKKILTIAIFIIMLAAPSITMQLTNVSATPGAKLELVNPENGTNIFNFTASEKTVGDTIRIDVMVSNAPDLFSWQIAVSWDPTLLEYNSLDKTGTVFQGKPVLEGIDVSTPGLIVYGQMLLSPPGIDVTEGKLITITLKIIKGVSMLNPIVECDLTFANIGRDTFLLNSAGTDIPIDEVVNGHYKYEWVIPPQPRFYLKPSTIKPAKLGDVFAVEVWIADVDPAWEIIAVQFSIMWNTTLIEPAEPYYDPGTFFEAFQYHPDGLLYASDINTHARPPPMTPIPDDYNYSTIGILLLPDPDTGYTYHPPFPQGEGKLATLYFKAKYETMFPVEAWSLIEFITFKYPDGTSQDMLVLNTYGIDIGYSAADPANYRAPIHYNRVVHTVTVDGQSFIIVTCSNGEIAPNSVVPLIEENALQFNITGTAGTAGFVNVTIPKTLLNGNPSGWAIYVNGESVVATITWNETHTFVYIEFTFTGLDTVKVVGTWIVPEFSVAPLLLISFASSTLALSLLKVRKRKK